MKQKIRYLAESIKDDLGKKMVFVGGPRQVGKTTLALSLIGPRATPEHPAYMNWDRQPDKTKINELKFPANEKFWIFDELHKKSKWKSYLKGLFDTYKTQKQILVTGSAKLNVFKRGGDALTGRYHYWTLHPFSLTEMYGRHPTSADAESLLQFGPFPEPLVSQSERTLRRWQLDRKQQIVTEDIRDLTRILELDKIDLLIDALPARVGNPLSINNLARDLDSAHETVRRWLATLELLYVSYYLAPYGFPKIRAVKKEQKPYLWDWSTIQETGFRFENMVAGHLLKYCNFITEHDGYPTELRYIRDTDGREIDFVVIKNKVPLFAVECKWGERGLSKHIPYFVARTPIPKFYQVHMGSEDYETLGGKARVLPFHKFVSELSLK